MLRINMRRKKNTRTHNTTTEHICMIKELATYKSGI